MTVAFDAASENGSNATTDPVSWTHTPVGTPRGVLVLVVHNSAGSGEIDAVTYGGVSMTAVSGSGLIGSGGEPLIVYGYFLGSSVPSGAQTVSVDVNAVTAKRAACITLTGSANLEVVDTTTIDSGSAANPSATLSLGSRTSFCALVLGSGHGTAADITPLTNWTSVVEPDFGSRMGAMYRYDIVDSADVTMGWTQLAEDAYALGVAISEVTGGASGVPRFQALNRRRRAA